MVTILELPREIRDLIYMAVFNSELSPPASPAECRHDRNQISSEYGPSEYFGEHCNHYPMEPVSISCSGLLLTCRQVRAEVLDVIARLKVQNQLQYKIDCIIEDEKFFCPTWLSVPVVSFDIDTVEVNFRIFGQRNGRCGFTPGDGGPSFLIWSLFALLNRFLERGPNFLSPFKSRQKINVKLITLNIVTPTEPTEGFIPEDWQRSYSRTTGVIHPKTVLRSIQSELNSLLQKTRYTTKYATTVYNGVHRVKLMLDGEIKMEWDLVAMESERQKAIGSST